MPRKRYFGLVMADGIWTGNVNFWTASSGGPNYGSTTNIPFTGTFTVGSSAATVYLERTFTTNYSKGIFGVRMYLNTTGAFFDGTTTPTCILIHLLDGTTSQLSLRVRGDKTLGVYRGSTLIASGTFVYPHASFIHMEWEVEIANSTAADIKLKVYTGGGVTDDITITAGTDTQAGSNAYFNKVRVGVASSGTAVPCAWCDWYFIDPTDGSAPTSFLGDTRILLCRPNGNGAANQWLNNSGNGTNNYTRVDETVHNSDTDYIEANTAGDRESFTFTDITSTYIVKAVGLHTTARKTDAGARELKAYTRQSSTNYDGVSHVLASTYATGGCFSQFWGDNPATSTSWSASEVNGAEFGVKVEV